MLSSQAEKWDKVAYTHNQDREVASHAYLDLIAGKKTKNVQLVLKLKLGSPMLIEVPYILKLLGNVRGKTVLDAGCGGGFYSLWLGRNGAKVLGVDGSKEMINIAKEKASRNMLDTRFLVGDITNLRIEDNMFDLVLSTLVLHDMKDLDKAISELVRVTRKGGDIVISILHPIVTAGTPGGWVRESGRKLFRKLDNYFTIRELEAVWETAKKERVHIKFYHRPLQAFTQLFLEKGCVLTDLIEPQPHKVYRKLNPRYDDPIKYEDMKRVPYFMILKFRKTDSSP